MKIRSMWNRRSETKAGERTSQGILREARSIWLRLYGPEANPTSRLGVVMRQYYLTDLADGRAYVAKLMRGPELTPYQLIAWAEPDDNAPRRQAIYRVNRTPDGKLQSALNNHMAMFLGNEPAGQAQAIAA